VSIVGYTAERSRRLTILRQQTTTITHSLTERSLFGHADDGVTRRYWSNRLANCEIDYKTP